ncbi:MAG TPA: four helix bundle protein [Candidatus Paceibacterota bacterium]|nr:four helix bundle protein [Candidatus Paceibacterota bacterium]
MNEANSKGHHSDLERTETRVNALAFAERKAEKLATAVYLISDIMEERDALRWKLREEGISVLSNIGHARASSESDRSVILRLAEKGIERVGSLLDIARAAKLISEMNAAIVRREYVALREMLEAERTASERAFPVRTLALTERFFAIDTARLPKENISLPEQTHVEESRMDTASINEPHITPKESTPVRPIEVRAKEERVDRSMSDTSRTMSDSPTPISRVAESPRAAAPAMTPRVVPQMIAPIEQKVAAPVARFDARPSVSPVAHQTPAPAKKSESVNAPHRDHDATHDRAGKDDRRKIILTLLRHSRDLTVKDIQKGIPGVSEKTVQRELLAMVADGTLQKKGERRWSRYSLKPGASI